MIPGHPWTHSFFPEGPAAHQLSAENRAARIRGDRASRPAPTLREQQYARERRAREREAAVQSDLGEYMSAAPLQTADPLHLGQL